MTIKLVRVHLSATVGMQQRQANERDQQKWNPVLRPIAL
jgi:hypothetical protein